MINLIYDSVDYWAEHSPDKAAFTYLDCSISYRELSELSARLSGVLQAKGVRRGDRVWKWPRLLRRPSCARRFQPPCPKACAQPIM